MDLDLLNLVLLVLEYSSTKFSSRFRLILIYEKATQPSSRVPCACPVCANLRRPICVHDALQQKPSRSYVHNSQLSQHSTRCSTTCATTTDVHRSEGEQNRSKHDLSTAGGATAARGRSLRHRRGAPHARQPAACGGGTEGSA